MGSNMSHGKTGDKKRYKSILIVNQEHSVALQDMTKRIKGYTKRGNCLAWNIS